MWDYYKSRVVSAPRRHIWHARWATGGRAALSFTRGRAGQTSVGGDALFGGKRVLLPGQGLAFLPCRHQGELPEKPADGSGAGVVGIAGNRRGHDGGRVFGRAEAFAGSREGADYLGNGKAGGFYKAPEGTCRHRLRAGGAGGRSRAVRRAGRTIGRVPPDRGGARANRAVGGRD